MPIAEVVLIVVVATAGGWDVATSRIPNWLTYPAVAIGVAAAAAGASPSLAGSLWGLAVGFVPFFVLYLFGGLGGGDVKLMAAVGALGGFPFVLNAMITAVVVGGLIAVLLVVWEGKALSALRFVGSSFAFVFNPRIERARLDVSRPVPFGVAICLGTLATQVAVWQGYDSPAQLLLFGF